MLEPQKPRLLEQARQSMRLRQFSLKIEKAYVDCLTVWKGRSGKTAGIVEAANTVTNWPYCCFGLLPGQVDQRFAKQTALQGK